MKPSKYISTCDQEKCINCGECAYRCQFTARTLIEEEKTFNPDQCFGCGLSVTSWSENAIDVHQCEVNFLSSA